MGDATPQRTGFYPTKGVDKLNGVKWKFRIEDTESSDPHFIPPLITFHPTPVRTCPAAARGIVCFGGNDILYAVAVGTGREKWRFKSTFKTTNLRPSISDPLVADGIVYVGTGESEGPGALVALDLSTGKEVWKLRTKRPCDGAILENGAMYFCSGDYRGSLVHAIEMKTRKELWDFQTDGWVIGPAVKNGVVCVATNQKCFALDAKTGERRWTVAIGTVPGQMLAIVDEMVLLPNGERGLIALNLNTGKEIWRFFIVASCAPAVASGTVFVGGTSNGRDYLFAVDTKTGKEAWRFKSPHTVTAISLSKGMVYLATRGRAVYALDADRGAEKWSFDSKGEFFSRPAVHDGVLYIGCDDGCLYALH